MTAWFQKSPDPSQAAKEQPPRAPASKAPPPSVSKTLQENAVLVAQAWLDKDSLLESLVRRLCEAGSLGDPQPYLAKVLERERGISTTLDTGLSLPHARMDQLDRTVAALGAAPQGIADPKQPGLKIRVMFLFFSPNKPDAIGQHLQLLRAVSSLFEPSLIDEVARAASPAAALELIRRREAAS